MNTSIDMEKLREDAVHIFNSGFTCSESVIYAIKKNFELEMSDDAIAMSSGFPWGLGGGGWGKPEHDAKSTIRFGKGRPCVFKKNKRQIYYGGQ